MTIVQFDQGALDEDQYTKGYGAPTGTLPLYGQPNQSYKDVQNSDFSNGTKFGSTSGSFGEADSNNPVRTWQTPVTSTFGTLTLPISPTIIPKCPGGYHPTDGLGWTCVPNPKGPPPDVQPVMPDLPVAPGETSSPPVPSDPRPSRDSSPLRQRRP